MERESLSLAQERRPIMFWATRPGPTVRANSKPTVTVHWRDHKQWSVTVYGYNNPGDHAHVVVAWYSTRDSANAYAKNLRKALRGDIL
jgi:hypothetical protein